LQGVPLRPGHEDSPADCVSRAARRLLLGLSMRQYSEAGHWPQPAGRNRNEPEPAHAPARAGSRQARPTSSRLDNSEGPQRDHAAESRPSRAAARPRKHDDEGHTQAGRRLGGELVAATLAPSLTEQPQHGWNRIGPQQAHVNQFFKLRQQQTSIINNAQTAPSRYNQRMDQRFGAQAPNTNEHRARGVGAPFLHDHSTTADRRVTDSSLSH
jgi:hypothetical protein